MMRARLIVMAAVILALAACAAPLKDTRSMAEVIESPEKKALLVQRVNEFWTAFVAKDYERVYEMHDPFFRVRTPNRLAYAGSLGKVIYHSYEIKDVQVMGNVAIVTVDMIYSLPKTRVKALEFSQPPTPGSVEERWLFIYDKWYREFYSHMMESGVAEY